MQALEQAGVAGFENRVTHHLSIGEQRRVCLAGVLACDPSILVLDEPTSSLDPKGRRELMKLLRQIPITKLIATHDLEFVVELCTRVIVMDRGTVVAQGPTIEVLSNEELMLQHHLESPHILHHLHANGGGQTHAGRSQPAGDDGGAGPDFRHPCLGTFRKP